MPLHGHYPAYLRVSEIFVGKLVWGVLRRVCCDFLWIINVPWSRGQWFQGIFLFQSTISWKSVCPWDPFEREDESKLVEFYGKPDAGKSVCEAANRDPRFNFQLMISCLDLNAKWKTGKKRWAQNCEPKTRLRPAFSQGFLFAKMGNWTRSSTASAWSWTLV